MTGLGAYVVYFHQTYPSVTRIRCLEPRHARHGGEGGAAADGACPAVGEGLPLGEVEFCLSRGGRWRIRWLRAGGGHGLGGLSRRRAADRALRLSLLFGLERRVRRLDGEGRGRKDHHEGE